MATRRDIACAATDYDQALENGGRSAGIEMPTMDQRRTDGREQRHGIERDACQRRHRRRWQGAVERSVCRADATKLAERGGCIAAIGRIQRNLRGCAEVPRPVGEGRLLPA